MRRKYFSCKALKKYVQTPELSLYYWKQTGQGSPWIVCEQFVDKKLPFDISVLSETGRSLVEPLMRITACLTPGNWKSLENKANFKCVHKNSIHFLWKQIGENTRITFICLRPYAFKYAFCKLQSPWVCIVHRLRVILWIRRPQNAALKPNLAHCLLW